ncbi:MAG: hypothetical protein ACI8PZ_007269, partial [Myxococcota bacterium]
MLLHIDSVRALVSIAVTANLDRTALLAGVNPLYIGALDVIPRTTAQLFADLARLSKDGYLPDGSCPLAIWLDNAAFLAGRIPSAKAFTDARSSLPGPAAKASEADPVEARGVPFAVPVIDRIPLRTEIRRLREPFNPTTLVVRGKRGTGRTRTADFVRHLAQPERVCSVTDAGRLSPIEIVRDTIEMVIAPPGTVHSTAQLDTPYKNTELAMLVVRWVRELAEPVWFVFDDLDPLTSPDHPV